MTRPARRGASLDIGCRVDIDHTPQRFGAHVILDGDPELHPGDRVTVYGPPITILPDCDISVRRRARIERAGPLGRALMRLRGRFEITELYEVSFTPGRLS